MFNLNGWNIDKSKFSCKNVIVYNMDSYWFIMVDGKTLEGLAFYTAEDALLVAKQCIKCD